MTYHRDPRSRSNALPERAAALMLFVIALCAIVPRIAMAVDKATLANAMVISNAWLKLVDDGNYGDSWDHASSYFRDNVTKETWQQKATGVRQPLGAVVSRKIIRVQYATSLPGAPDGQYVVVEYRTTFAHKKAALETVTPMLDKDGKWRVSGYYIK